MCYPVWGGTCKRSLDANKKTIACVMVAAGFLSHYMNGPLPFNLIKNVLSVSLNKTFPSFLMLTTYIPMEDSWIPAVGDWDFLC